LSIKEVEDYFESFDKTKIYYHSWLPDKKNDIIFVGVHGAAVNSDSMRNLAEYLAKLGYPFYAIDKRGHGKTENLKGHYQNFKDVLRDIKILLEFLSESVYPKRVILVGHSMGGAQSLAIGIDYPELVDAIVVSSPCLKLLSNGLFFLKIAASILGTLFPKGKISNGIEQSEAAKDPKMIKKMENDPYYVEKHTLRWTRELFRLQRYVKKNISKLSLPTFVMVPDDDRLVDAEYTKKLFAPFAQKKDIRLQEFKGQFHDLFNNLPEERELVFKEMRRFLHL
jgi:lysophospholipase